MVKTYIWYYCADVKHVSHKEVRKEKVRSDGVVFAKKNDGDEESRKKRKRHGFAGNRRRKKRI